MTNISVSTPEGIEEAIKHFKTLPYKQRRLLAFQADMLLAWTAIRAGLPVERFLDWSEAIARSYMNTAEIDILEEIEIAVEKASRDKPALIADALAKGMNAHEVMTAIVAQGRLERQTSLLDRIQLHREAAIEDFNLSTKGKTTNGKDPS